MKYAPQFDVFLVHSSRDKPEVRAIAANLKQRGLKPWLDEEQILPGRSFQDAIQQAIHDVKSVAIFIGLDGLGTWQALELKFLISRCLEAEVPIIPVLLPGVNQIPHYVSFLKEFNWVNFRDSIEDIQALNRLEWGITGHRPIRQPESTQTTASEHFDVFLCYQSKEQFEVKQIAEQLKKYEIRSWPEHWELPAEALWQELLTREIQKIDSLAVFVGNNGGPWEDEDIESFMWEFIEGGHLVVPVVLPNTLRELKFPVYLRRRQIVDFRKKDPDPMTELARLITEKVNR